MEVLGALLTFGLAIPVVLWIAETLLIAWLAAEKGRDAFGWGFLGLFLGPLALLALGFAPRGTYSKYALCSECREPVRGDSRRCPFCHVEYTDVRSYEENPYLAQ